MPLLISCSSCGAKLRAPDDAAGRSFKCPKCGMPFKVAAEALKPEPPVASVFTPPVASVYTPPVALTCPIPNLVKPEEYNKTSIPDDSFRQDLSADAQKQPEPNAEEPDETHRTWGQISWLDIAIAGGLTLLSVALLVLYQEIGLAGIVCLSFMLFLVLAVVSGIAWELFFKEGRTTACPHCKKWWARVQVGEQVIERKKCFGLVTRRGSSSSSGFALLYGDRHTYGVPTYSSSSTRWVERVPVVRTTYLLIYECKYCFSRWTREKIEEVEDFDIER